MAAATEHLLAERSFDKITIEEIAGRAGVSKGAFYARFDSKQALLRFLERTRFQSVLDDWSAFLEPARWADRPLDEFANALVARVLRIYREHEGVMREFVRRARLEPEPAVRGRGAELNRHVLHGVRSVLREHAQSLEHPSTERAVSHGLDLVRTMVADRVLFGASGPDGATSDFDSFEDEAARALRRYWGLE